MDTSLILTILGSVLGPLTLVYFWLRHLRNDIIKHIDDIVQRLDAHIDDEKQERIRKYSLLVHRRMDKLYQQILKKLGQIP